MESLFLDLDELTKETLALSGIDTSEQAFFEGKVPPSAPGLLFSVKFSGQTFCVKALVCKDLEAQYLQRVESSEELFAETPVQKAQYFQTLNVESAEIIFNSIANRRYPIEEERILNISDPGFYWWLDVQGNSISLYFENHGKRAKETKNLGPMGDSAFARYAFGLFKQAPEQEKFDFDLVIDEKAVHFHFCEDSNPSFFALLNLFQKGQIDFVNDFKSKYHFTDTQKYFFREIAQVRKFWLKVKECVENPILQ